jgi:hypothetical protein
MRVPIFPFLTPPDRLIDHAGWQLTMSDGSISPLPTDLNVWDYQTVLEFTGLLSIARTAVLEACQLGNQSGLSVLVTAHSDWTSTEQTVGLLELGDLDVIDADLRFQLPGEQLGGRLTLNTILVASNPVPEGPLAPAQVGSILWRTQHRTRLQGTTGQFPTDAVDFKKLYPEDPEAGWVLTIEMNDLDALFTSAARLTVNSGHPDIQQLLAGSGDPQADLLSRTMRWDVTRQMVMLALTSDDVLGADFDPEATSVGGILRNLLARIWPDTSPATVVFWWTLDPSRVERRIQSYCGLLP